MKRDFGSLTAQEALHVAIFIEERNADIYGQFAEMFADFRDPESLEIAAIFWDMAAEERDHGTRLQDRYFERFGTQPCSMTEDEISNFIEVPQLDNADLFSITRARLNMPPRHLALDVAIAAESSAMRYYSRLFDQTDDPGLAALYSELAHFEGEHVAALHRKKHSVRPASANEA
jgi:erythrin-vacuolar iron transport family protein